MVNGTIDFTQSSSSGRYIDGKIEWNSTASASSNTSTLITKIYVRKGITTDETLTIPTDGNWTYIITVDGTSVSGMINKSVLEEWVLLGTHTTTVTHNTDGSKSLTISGSITAPAGTLFVNHKTSGSKSVSLESISRVTTIDSLTSPNHRLDDTITALYTPKSSTCYNRRVIYLNVNGTLTEINTENLGQSAASQQTHTIKFSTDHLSKIYAKVTNTATAKIRVTFRTYSNSNYSTQIGSDQYREIDLTLPTSVAPTASLKITQVNNNSWLAGKKIYVAGLSGATVELTATPSINAQVTSTKITYDGTTHNAVQLNVTTLKKSGNIAFDAKVVDSRGRSATDSESITVLPYTPPVITSLTVERGTYSNGWTADEDGPDARVVFKATLTLINEGNVYSVTFKLGGKTTTPNHGTATNIGSGTDGIVYFLGLDSEKSYTLQLTATDKAGGTGTASITIPTANVTIEFHKSGKGIAFGKTSEEEDTFECAWDAEFRGSVKRIRENGSIVTLDDTGWIDLGISDSVTTTSSTSAGHYIGCAYRVVNGNHVYVAFNVRAEYSGSAVTVSKNPIPSEYRPKLQPYAIVTLNGKRVSRILVSRTTGHAMIDWIHNVADDTDGTYTPEPEVHTATWIDGYIDYFI